MRHSPTESLIFPAGVMMTGIVLLALTSMLTSLIIAETARGDAAAINVAGSLRMQSYRLATYLQAEPADQELLHGYVGSFEHSLQSRELRAPIPAAQDHPIRRQYRAIGRHWQERMRPAVMQAAAAPAQAQAAYLHHVDVFVDEVDALVRLLQQRAEAKLQLLRLVQGFALFLTLLLVFYSMYRLLTGFLPPLQDLLRVANQARQGDFSARTNYRGNDELGMLSHTVNLMAEDLSQMYRELEQRVEDKTAALQRSNLALQLLYQTSRELTREPGGDTDYGDIVKRLEVVLGGSRVTLCLSGADAAEAYQSITGNNGEPPEFCRAPHCGPCFAEGCSGEREGEVTSVPIRESGRQYGVILVQHGRGEAPQPWQLELVKTVAEHIATANYLAQQNEQERRLALMDERAVIARELHDSLAQALSYLKIQVSRLQLLIKQEAPQSDKEGVIEELRTGLNSAYRQLRELLNTFRLKMNEAGLEPALRSTTTEFAERGELDIMLDYQLRHCPLSPNEEIHVLQIVREALANIVHHAHASRATIALCTAGGEVEVQVRDDGVGIGDDWQRANHYGVSIMQERAETLGGSLAFRSHPEGGTEVTLRFRPRGHRPGNHNDLLSVES